MILVINNLQKMASRGGLYRKMRPTIATTRLNFHKISHKKCTFKRYSCPLPCIEGYVFCIQHILDDESAPFQHCSFVYPASSKRCPQAAPKTDYAESFCPEHMIKKQRSRNRAGKAQPPLTTEKLVASLSHYVKRPHRSQIGKETDSIDVEGDTSTVNPFVDINASAVNNSLSNVLDYCSESDSDIDATIVGRTTKCKDEESSDAESADSGEEDILKYASVLSTEEALLLFKEKMNRLKRLYTEQLERLKNILKERRRDLLFNIQKEVESHCSIREQEKPNAREFTMAEKIKCLNNYRHKFGAEALMRKKMKEKRLLMERKGTSSLEKRGSSIDTTRYGSKCIFTEGGVKCCAKTLPHSKYCVKHILEDNTQVLFHPCGFVNGDHTCREPLPAMEPCVYHLDLPPTQITYNTTLSSEDDEEVKEEAKDVPLEIKTENEHLQLSRDNFEDAFPTDMIKEEIVDDPMKFIKEEMDYEDIGHFEDVHTT